jgi:hypothetical protein
MDLSYPIGEFTLPEDARARRAENIGVIADAPVRFREAVRGLDDKQLDTPYRPGGWTVRQVIHHVADSHMNAYIRFRLALTEQEPTIKPYDQAKWAEIVDAKSAPVELSLGIIDGLHARWTTLLEGLPEEAFALAFLHPERGRVTLEVNVAMYAWHSLHHAAHITGLRERMGWR